MNSYKVKVLFNNKKEEQDIQELLLISTRVINRCFELLFNKRNNKISLKEGHTICYYKLKEEFPNIPVQIIVKSYKEAISIYKTIRKNKHKIDKPPVRKNSKLQLDDKLFSNFTTNGIWLTNPHTPKKRTKVSFLLYPKLIEMFNKYKTGAPALLLKNNDIYLQIPFDIPTLTLKNLNVIGYDLGATRLAVSSNGIIIDDKEYKKRKRTLRYLKRCLQAKGTKSAKRKLKKIKNKERNINKNFNHCLANKMLDCKESIIVLEDLKKIKENTKYIKNTKIKNTQHNNRMGQISFYALKQILSYKALLLGKVVATVSPAFTSQNDWRGIEAGTRKGRRYYTSDNKVFDADWNAAINIRNRYRKSPSPVLPLDGTLQRQAVCQSANRNLEL